eukprot:Macronucleus_4436.p1 GENE.Macronucleus_4436~~Macronucleus_4436.p1  ORF type:complete len:193 (+),score=85.84 Macronucleus_4436:1-579(+)
MADNANAAGEEQKHDVEYANEEAKQTVDIPTVKTSSGEENLECLMKIRAKLFRWRDEQWKERGIGNAKLMRDRAEKKIRFIMRQEKTLKPVANFIVSEAPQCVLKPMPNAEKAYVWFVQDFSEGEAQVEKFAIRLRTLEDAEQFKSKLEASQEFNNKARDGSEDLVWAETVEDVEEVVDDIETNKPAEGGED